MYKVNKELNKLVNMYSGSGNFIKYKGNIEIDYCLCGSGKKYNDCCRKQIINFLDIEIIDNYDYNSKDLLGKVTPDLVDVFWKDIVGESSDKKPLCVCKSCNNKSIKSHLFGYKYLQKNIKNEISIIKPLVLKWQEVLQSSKSLSTELFCSKCDSNYNKTDNIESFSEIINDDKKIYNFVIKTLYFRFKATSLNMRFLIADMKKNKSLDLLNYYFETYIIYNFVKSKIDDYENRKSVKLKILCKAKFEKDVNECNIFYSSITLKDNYPFYIGLVHDNFGLYFIITCFEDNFSAHQINQIKNDIEKCTKVGKNYLIKYIEDYFELKSPKNRIGYIHGNDLVDIGLKI